MVATDLLNIIAILSLQLLKGRYWKVFNLCSLVVWHLLLLNVGFEICLGCHWSTATYPVTVLVCQLGSSFFIGGVLFFEVIAVVF